MAAPAPEGFELFHQREQLTTRLNNILEEVRHAPPLPLLSYRSTPAALNLHHSCSTILEEVGHGTRHAP